MSRWVRHQWHFQRRRASSSHTKKGALDLANKSDPTASYVYFRVQGWINPPSSVGIYDSQLLLRLALARLNHLISHSSTASSSDFLSILVGS
jgi:hypothetical protein